MGYNLLLKKQCFLQPILIVSSYHYLNKNVVDKSYFVEFSEITTFVIERISVGYTMK